jgi:hypothetical protein
VKLTVTSEKVAPRPDGFFVMMSLYLFEVTEYTYNTIGCLSMTAETGLLEELELVVEPVDGDFLLVTRIENLLEGETRKEKYVST